jgi:hypothetical protein
MTADFKRFCYFRIQQTLTGMVPGACLLTFEVNIIPCSVVSPVTGPIYIQSILGCSELLPAWGRCPCSVVFPMKGYNVHSVNVQAVQNFCQREEDVPVQLYHQ